jgi:hypothetical protein
LFLPSLCLLSPSSFSSLFSQVCKSLSND